MKSKLNIIFMGSGLYGSLVLNSLDRSNFNILNIFTKSNKVISRNIKKQEYFNVESHDIPITEISDFSKEDLDIITKSKPDLIIVASFGLILPESMLSIPHYGVVNIHPSLLPKYKGLNTHKRAIINKEKFSGCTVHFVNEKLDSGKIILQQKVKILSTDDYKSLSKRVLKVENKLYPRAINKLLSKI